MRRTFGYALLLILGGARGNAMADTIRIVLLDGNTGKPISHTGLFISLCCSRSAAGVQGGATNGSGEIVLTGIEDARILTPMKPNEKFKYCQDSTDHGVSISNPASFAVDEIMRTGVVAPNHCNSRVNPPLRPGTLVFFMRPLTWWEYLTQPPQM